MRHSPRVTICVHMRSFFPLLFFLACFALGSFAPGLLPSGDADGNDLPFLEAQREILSAVPRGEKGFEPEFVGLPSFDDLDVLQKPKGRLIHLFDDAMYRESEVVAESGESWLVLAKQHDVYSLTNLTATVRKLRSISWPGDERDAKLAFKGRSNTKPILALNHFEGLSERTVETLYSRFESGAESGGIEMSSGFDRAFVLRGTEYRLRVSTGMAVDKTPLAVLVVESGTRKQVVMQTHPGAPGDRDILGSLLWVGDLDGDSRLDLYFDQFNEKGYTHTQLHLSSFAKPGQLVGFASWFGAAGC